MVLYSYHRYHNSTEEFGFRLIPEAEYVDHLSFLSQVEYQGNSPKAIVAWGADMGYYYDAFETDEDGEYVRQSASYQRVRDAFNSELDPGQSIQDYMIELNPQIYGRLRDAAETADAG